MSVTKETKRKISITKSETGRNEILNASNKIPKETKINLTIPSHRKKKRISIEEYKKLIAKGKTTLDVCKITSKQLVYFYNAMLKGRINLTKENFETLYNNGMSLEEISKQSGIPREHMTHLREFYGIKRKGATFQKRLANEKPLSQEAKNIIIGSMLGDGHITKWGYFSEKHSPAQLEYLKWKASFFPHITTDKSWSYYESIDKRSGSLIKTHNYRTTTHSWLIEIEKLWYKTVNGKRIKIVPNEIDEWMNKQVLAVWFMDDGHTDWMYRNGKKISKGSNPSCRLCTESFSESEIDKLMDTVSDLGISSRLRFKDNDTNKPNIRFSAKSSLDLIHKIYPYIQSELLYKVDENVYSGIRDAKKTQ